MSICGVYEEYTVPKSHVGLISLPVVLPLNRDPSLCRLQPAHSGPFHSQSVGPPLAQQVPEMQRLPVPAGRQVLQQGRQRLLQRGLLQVSN